MKRTFILTSAVVAMTALVFTSCRPSRVWATKDKEQRNYRNRDDDRYRNEDRYYDRPAQTAAYRVALIVMPTPGFVMRQGQDGRYYHRSPQGFMYWKGYDNRFYLDAAQLRTVSFTRYEYEEWRRNSPQGR